MTWRPQGGPSAQPLPRRLAVRPRLLTLEDRSVPAVTDPVPTDAAPADPAAPPAPPPETVSTTDTTPPPTVIAAPLLAAGAEVGSQPLVKVYDTSSGEVKFSFLAYEGTFRGGVRVAT